MIFGGYAAAYEASRPGYPPPLIDDLVAWAGPQRCALEVGAGTGKATRLVAAHGIRVLAVEPDGEMAAIGQASATGDVEFVVSDFESADLGGRRFPLLYAAQAWHWVDPATRYSRARRALADGGRLVAMWNREDWSGVPLRAALDAAYDRHAPELRGGPVRPRDARDVEDERLWELEIESTEGFGDPEVRRYDWSLSHTADAYADLVATHSDVQLLEPERRERLLTAIRDAIDDHGGSFELPMFVRVCVAIAIAS